MKEISMKTVTNVMAGGFCKGVFLPVDASIRINNIFKGKADDVRFGRGKYRSFGRNGVELGAALELLTLVFGRIDPMQSVGLILCSKPD